MGKGAKIFGGVALAAAIGLGYVAIDKRIETVRAEREQMALESKESGLFSNAEGLFENGYLDSAKAKYDSAQAVFPDTYKNEALGIEITDALVARQTRQDSLTFLLNLEKLKEAREGEMRADFGPVDPRSGLMEYSLKGGENLWTAAEYFLSTQNLDREDERRTSDPWSESYDLLVAEGRNPDSLGVSDPVYFKATEEQRIQAQLEQEELVLSNAYMALFENGDRTKFGDDLISLSSRVDSFGNKELSTKLMDVAELRMERQEKVEFEKTFKAHSDGRLGEALVYLTNAIDLHRNREATGFLEEDPYFYDIYAGLKDKIASEMN